VAVTAPWAPLLEGVPSIHKIWALERRKERASRAKAVASLALRVRAEHYDCVVNFHASPSSATLAFASGARMRSIHFHGHNDRNRYSTVIVPGKGELKPIIERDMDAVRALGLTIPAGRMPQLYLQPAETRSARERLLKYAATAPVLGLGLGASRPAKSWPVERYAATAVEWCVRKGGTVVAFVAAAEEATARDFLKAVDDVLGAGELAPDQKSQVRSRVICEIGLPIRSLAAMIAECAIFLGNDSGPRHLAVALDRPTLTLFGPEDPFEWHPYPRDRHDALFIEKLPCRRDALPGFPEWCGLDVCVSERHRCMTEITSEEVLSRLERFST
jgi:ADP-heptose:LPS heptosyltransferase